MILRLSFAAVLLIAGVLIALPYIPFTIMQPGTMAHPMRHTRAESFAYAKWRLFLLGGIPGDAVLQFGGSTIRESDRNGHLVDPSRMSDLYVWIPRDQWGTSDRMLVAVDERSDGTLYAPMIIRDWRPAWLRAIDQWYLRAHAETFAQPSSTQAMCTGRPDVAAALRVLGTHPAYLLGNEKVSYDGSGKKFLAHQGILFHWTRPIELHLHEREARFAAFPFPVKAAWVSDERDPAQPQYRLVSLFIPSEVTRRWHWSAFSSRDDEHVCHR